jgi:hypothetical protein
MLIDRRYGFSFSFQLQRSVHNGIPLQRGSSLLKITNVVFDALGVH